MVRPIKWRRRLELLSAAEVQKIHDATLKVLKNTGVVMPMPADKVEKLQDMGLLIDKETFNVRFPESVVEKALQSAPPTYTLYARSPENDLPINGKFGYMTTDGSATRIVDLQTGETRNSTYQDLCDLAVVADYMPQIGFFWPSVSAQDKPPHVQALYELKAILMNSSKHIQAMTAVSPEMARGTVEICQSIVGGAAALKAKPIISNFQCSISPLAYDEKGLESAFIFLEAGVPTGFLNMQIGCSTAPATVAGNLVLGNAEILSGCVVAQLLYPGAPIFYGSCATTMELISAGVNCSSPEDNMLQNLCTQMARFYKLPSNIGTFAPSSKTADWECGVKNAMSGAMSVLGNADMMCGAGLTSAASVFSIEQMLLDGETYDYVARSLEGIAVNDETCAVDVIDAVGSTGHYMMEDHTIEHMYEMYQPEFMHRGSLADYEAKGRPNPFDVANAKAREILATHKPVIEQNDKDIDTIIGEYEKGLR